MPNVYPKWAKCLPTSEGGGNKWGNKGFKLKKTYSLSVFMCFVSYCILAFANISAIDVAPYFFIILGILLSEVNHIKILNKK